MAAAATAALATAVLATGATARVTYTAPATGIASSIVSFLHPDLDFVASIDPEKEMILEEAVMKRASGREFTANFFLLGMGRKDPGVGLATSDRDCEGWPFVFERSGGRYPNLVQWYMTRCHDLLQLPRETAVPPISSQLCYGDQTTYLTFKDIQAVLAAPRDPIYATLQALTAANQQIDTLRTELQALEPIGTSLANVTAVIAKATALKEALKAKGALSIRFVEQCAEAGHLQGLEHLYFLEGLVEQLEGKLKRE
jgi:hypothetical protein